jgi:hypothetical protein
MAQTKRSLENKQKMYEDKINIMKIEEAGLQSLINNPDTKEDARHDHVIQLNVLKAGLDEQNNELQKVTLELEEKFLTNKLKSQQNVSQALDKFNAYFISSESQWYCIYSEENRRHQPKVNVVTTTTMKDMVFGATNWFADTDRDLKQIALDNNRYFLDVERSFLPQSKNTLNQMNELRKYWLKPIESETYHEAFDMLFSNLVGHDQAYKEQIERYIAYSYIKPYDIFAPNIDSSAKGGAGRDTVFRILEIIFTEECCGEAKKETVQGTHNGELWGKVWVKISESNNRAMDINELKNLTGGHNFRLRRMGENAVQAPRTFRFFMMSNNYEGTARLTGGGSTAEDRRWEPIFSTTSLLDTVAVLKGFELSSREASELLNDWQTNVYQNETEIAKWLYCIIQKYKPEEIQKLRPMHGQYYEQMVERQKNSFSVFMEKILELSEVSNCYDIDKIYKIFKIVSNTPLSKNTFSKKMCEWLLQTQSTEYEIKVKNIYTDEIDRLKRQKRQVVCIKDFVQVGGVHDDQTDNRLIFYIFDFIEESDEQGNLLCDDKGKDLGEKPHVNNIKQELF